MLHASGDSLYSGSQALMEPAKWDAFIFSTELRPHYDLRVRRHPLKRKRRML